MIKKPEPDIKTKKYIFFETLLNLATNRKHGDHNIKYFSNAG